MFGRPIVVASPRRRKWLDQAEAGQGLQVDNLSRSDEGAGFGEGEGPWLNFLVLVFSHGRIMGRRTQVFAS